MVIEIIITFLALSIIFLLAIINEENRYRIAEYILNTDYTKWLIEFKEKFNKKLAKMLKGIK